MAFLYTGQGSQYVNMLQRAARGRTDGRRTFAEADRVMTPLLGKPLSEYIFVDQADADAVAKAEEDLRQTAITQPAVLATDHRADPAAGRLRHRARHDDGPQPGRIRRAGCGRRACRSTTRWKRSARAAAR